MTRKIVFGLVASLVLACSSSAHAEFLIDAFNAPVTAGSGPSVVQTQNGISLEVTTNAPAAFNIDSNNTYQLGFISGGGALAAGNGDFVTFTYTWGGGTFDSLQSISGLQLESLPSNVIGDWDLDIDLGSGSFNGLDPSVALTPIALDNATQLSLTYTVTGPAGFLDFGGIGNTLFATPEPTSLLMLGGLGAFALARRRKR